MYLVGSMGFGLAFSVVMANSVAVVRWATMGEFDGRKWELHVMIRWMAWLSRARRMYWNLVS